MVAPTLEPSALLSFVSDKFGIDLDAGNVKALPSYDDQNMRVVDTASSTQYVLKVSHLQESADFLDMQNALMNHLASSGVPCPRPAQAKDGNYMARWADPPHIIRLVTFIPGKMYADVKASPELLLDLGKFLGKMDKALQGFQHDYAIPRLDNRWDLANALLVRDYLDDLSTDERRGKVVKILDQLETQALPAFSSLRKSVIHNDANDMNIVVSDDGQKVNCLIDFGDAVMTPTINNLAIALAYGMMGHDDPLEAGVQLVRGYHHEFPLTDKELDLLFVLAMSRLAVSVTMCSHSIKLDPENEYLSISEKPAWNLIDSLISRDAGEVASLFKKSLP